MGTNINKCYKTKHRDLDHVQPSFDKKDREKTSVKYADMLMNGSNALSQSFQTNELVNSEAQNPNSLTDSLNLQVR